jgi:hypothetical protein
MNDLDTVSQILQDPAQVLVNPLIRKEGFCDNVDGGKRYTAAELLRANPLIGAEINGAMPQLILHDHPNSVESEAIDLLKAELLLSKCTVANLQRHQRFSSIIFVVLLVSFTANIFILNSIIGSIFNTLDRMHDIECREGQKLPTFNNPKFNI